MCRPRSLAITDVAATMARLTWTIVVAATACSAESLLDRNAARRQLHAEAEASRETLLNAEVRASARCEIEPTLQRACSELLSFRKLGNLASGPVFQGASELCGRQAATDVGVRWVLDRAALLNGGDDFVHRMVPLLSAMGLRASLAHESAGGELTFAVDNDVWTPNELVALAHLLSKCARHQPIGGTRPAGDFEELCGVMWRPRPTSTWREWYLSALARLRARLVLWKL